MKANISAAIGISYQTSIINPDGSIAASRPLKSNLVLDSGLDLVPYNWFADLFRYCAVGTTQTGLKRDSGVITFTRAGTTITADSNYFDSGDVGRLFKFDSGEEAYIVSYTSQTSVECNIAGTVAAGEGTLWAVNQTGLFAEYSRTGNCSQNGGDNGSTFSVDTWTHKRTFIFPAEGAPVVYKEIGWSPSGGAGANLFGRDVIPGVGDSLNAGQQYKVVVIMTLKIGPATPTAVVDVGNNGFNTAGTAMIETTAGISRVSSDGNTYIPDYSAPSLEPSHGFHGFDQYLRRVYCGLITASWSQQSAITGGQPGGSFVNSARMTQNGYANGTRYIDYFATFAVGDANGQVYGVTFGSDFLAVTIKFTAAQTKDSDHTLKVTSRHSWTRILSNL